MGLARPSLDRRQAIGDGKPQVVVAMHRERGAIDIGHVLADVGDHRR